MGGLSAASAVDREVERALTSLGSDEANNQDVVTGDVE